MPSQLEVITTCGLGSLLIGGHAVVLNGVPRATFDLDFLIRQTQGNEWRKLLESNGYRLWFAHGSFQQWTPPPGLATLDLMGVDEGTWEKMESEARIHQLQGVSVKAVAPLHLIALKLHAMRYRSPDQREKDWQDVLGLITSNQINPSSPDLRHLVARHANPATQERFSRHYGLV